MDQETRELVFQLAHGYCMCSPGCVEKADQIHHLLSNSRINRMKYPLFINSIFNLLPIFGGCHLNKPIPKISEHQAQIYETYLQNQRWQGSQSAGELTNT